MIAATVPAELLDDGTLEVYPDEATSTDGVPLVAESVELAVRCRHPGIYRETCRRCGEQVTQGDQSS